MSAIEVASVARTIAQLLARCGHVVKAEWISDRAAVLADAGRSPAEHADAIKELHGVVLGMGGLMDLRLEAETPEDRRTEREELDRLADQLYEMTR